ncbi:wax ester/triacylglycerol synthase family O-acyltransferase [Nocardia sp. NBC_01503]|uniref:wax ester/triacylglycerol synthase family O-acyltransferase n=1 Tax=Nocardia sp. NBC_01503 TaxID=2975997 RepID=UPI002E7B26A0|nr:wax ester/triacylglycerol synthase family O-acyltransferase [Nocardia sp. NBC_01503]WTL29087.1 wax ester/triacylglycerol synthase family O-acyltransferase [Nocardia sp. NBC_01503]
MSELSPLDTGFLAMEDTDSHVSLGLGTVAIISGAPPTRAEFRTYVDRGLERHSRLRQRVRRAPLDLRAPVWEEDPNFDLGHHIRWTALPEPGDEAALRELVATELTERLDRDHPLWEVVVVEHLAHDRWAMIVKAHHTMADGISEVTLLESFCDPVEGGPIGSPALVGKPARTAVPSFASLAQWVSGMIRLPYTLPRSAVGAVRVVAPVLYAALAPAEASSLNGPIGRQRRYALARVALPEVREIATGFEVTVNDVAVAAVAAAYRRLLWGRGEPPTPGKVRVVVPVSRRTVDAKDILDNRVSAMIAYLPIELEHPVERLLAVHERIQSHRSRGEAEAERSVFSLAEWLPFAFVASVFRMGSYYPQQGVAALATNLPGPRHRLAMGGHEVLELWPCIPIALRVRTTIAILSYADQLTFGITGDYDTTSDIDQIAAGIASEIPVLLAHARDRRAQYRPNSVPRQALPDSNPSTD